MNTSYWGHRIGHELRMKNGRRVNVTFRDGLAVSKISKTFGLHEQNSFLLEDATENAGTN